MAIGLGKDDMAECIWWSFKFTKPQCWHYHWALKTEREVCLISYNTMLFCFVWVLQMYLICLRTIVYLNSIYVLLFKVYILLLYVCLLVVRDIPKYSTYMSISSGPKILYFRNPLGQLESNFVGMFIRWSYKVNGFFWLIRNTQKKQ